MYLFAVVPSNSEGCNCKMTHGSQHVQTHRIETIQYQNNDETINEHDDNNDKHHDDYDEHDAFMILRTEIKWRE